MRFPHLARPRLLVSLVTALASLAAGGLMDGCAGSATVPPSQVYAPTPYYPTPAPQPLPQPAPLPAPLPQPGPIPAPAPVSHANIQLGIDVLAAQNFSVLQGKRVGLLTHPAGVNAAGVSTIDVLRHAPGVKLVALYAAEHGIYGTIGAGASMPKKQMDSKTGLPIYTVYFTVDGDKKGDFRKASPDMLGDIDVMVIDLQDVGTRSYTFISCLLCTMEACFEQNKTVVVLDRPNPLGGLKVGGPIIEDKWMSYVGALKIPYVHGLTIGEVAYLAKDNLSLLPISPQVSDPVRKLFQVSPEVWNHGKLIVVPMSGWHRSMLWADTGLPWIPTSPNIPTAEAAFGYSLTGLAGVMGNFKHGVDTPYPFRLLNYSPHIPPDQLAATLNALKLGGLSFMPLAYGEKNEKSGVYVAITNWNAVEPTRLAFELMKLDAAWTWTKSGNPYARAAGDKLLVHDFNIYGGSDAWWREITTKGRLANVDGFFKLWDAQDAAYQQMTRKWWLYQP